MNKKLTVSLSPHTYHKNSVDQIMRDVIIALIPALAVATFVFGINALRVVVIAVTSTVFFEFVIQKFMLKVKPTINDGSAFLTGLLLAFNLPSNLPWWIIMIGALVAIGIGKCAFGGLGNNPFNPALVGRVFILVSFPVAMTSWPKPSMDQWASLDAITSATPLAIMKEGLKNGEAMGAIVQKIPSYAQLTFGNLGGSLGEISVFALLIGFVYLLKKKVLSWHIPIAMVTTIVLFTGILWKINPNQYANPLFHILTGGVMLGAIFMATDYVTSPMTKKGMLIFGVGIGFLTVLIRIFGAYPEGVSFAILIMNAFVPLINKACKPKRFGEGR